MKFITIIIILITHLSLCAQNITVTVSASQEVQFNKGLYGLTLVIVNQKFKNEMDEKRILDVKQLKKFCSRNKIEQQTNSFSAYSDFMTAHSVLIDDNALYATLIEFLNQFDNVEMTLINFELENGEEVEKEILSNVMAEGSDKANKIAGRLGKKIDQVVEIKSLNNEDDQVVGGSWNLNKSIGWTAYPPLSSLPILGDQDDGEMITTIFRSFEVPYTTK